jgi:hypothetical protein
MSNGEVAINTSVVTIVNVIIIICSEPYSNSHCDLPAESSVLYQKVLKFCFCSICHSMLKCVITQLKTYIYVNLFSMPLCHCE